MRIAAVLFDLDGTLVDTYTLIFESFRHAARQVLGRDLTEVQVLARWGLPLRARFDQVDPQQVDDLVRAYLAFYEANHDRLAAPFRGVPDLLQALRGWGCRLAIVTSKRRETTALALHRFDLGRYFDAVLTEEDVGAVKPAGEPILAALRRLNVPPARAMMVGDSVVDLRAARAAGVIGVAALWGAQDAASLVGAPHAAHSPHEIAKLVRSFED